MKLAIMQPYFCPYLGYFQLINAVDVFVVYDNIEYTKKGWVNRNRILINNEASMFTIPLRKGSDFLNINERFLAEDASKKNSTVLRQIHSSYFKAPYFKEIFPVLEDIFLTKAENLFQYIFYSLKTFIAFLDINTKMLISSDIKIEHTLKGKEKVLAICKNLEADTYINPIGGSELYSKDYFLGSNIRLYFLQMNDVVYKQNSDDFIQSLSIIDVLMFNGKKRTTALLNEYKLS